LQIVNSQFDCHLAATMPWFVLVRELTCVNVEHGSELSRHRLDKD